MAGETLADARTGKNERHALVGLLRQSVFGRLAGYEDVNDACSPVRRGSGSRSNPCQARCLSAGDSAYPRTERGARAAGRHLGSAQSNQPLNLRSANRAGGEPIKGRRRKTPEPKRRNVRKQTPPPNAPNIENELEFRLDTLLQSAVRLCRADQGTVAQRKGDTFYRSVSYGFSPAYLDYVKDIPVKPGRDTGTGRALLEGKVIHIPDVLADPDFTWKEGQRLGGFRTVLGVPMLREGVAVGVLALTRSERIEVDGEAEQDRAGLISAR